MKLRTVILIGIALDLLCLSASAQTNGTWVTKLVWQPSTQAPNPAKPPTGWPTNTIPSGQIVPFYDYQAYALNVFGTNQLMWQRAYFWLPAQTFKYQVLCEEGTNLNKWMDTGYTLSGPCWYYDLSMPDGNGISLRLVAK